MCTDIRSKQRKESRVRKEKEVEILWARIMTVKTMRYTHPFNMYLLTAALGRACSRL